VTPGIGLLASAVLVFVTTSLVAAFAIAALDPAARPFIRGLPPKTRASLLLTIACAPAAVGLAFVTVALVPSLLPLFGLGIDHCTSHDHHAHFCLVHAPWRTGDILDGLVLLGAALAGIWLLTDVWIRLRRVHGIEHALRTAQVAHPAPYRVVDSGISLALTAGLMRPRIYLSSGLIAALSPTELGVVVGHEQAHQRRRDSLWQLVADLVSRLHLPGIRRRLLADLTLATERACDEEAALSSGDRLAVAEAILKVARLCGKPSMHTDVALATATGADVEARIDALLRPAPESSPWPQGLGLAGCGLLAGLGWVFADPLHHAVESALHLLID